MRCPPTYAYSQWWMWALKVKSTAICCACLWIYVQSANRVAQQIADDLQGNQLNWKPVGAQHRRSTSKTSHCVNFSNMFLPISCAASFAQSNCFAGHTLYLVDVLLTLVKWLFTFEHQCSLHMASYLSYTVLCLFRRIWMLDVVPVEAGYSIPNPFNEWPEFMTLPSRAYISLCLLFLDGVMHHNRQVETKQQ